MPMAIIGGYRLTTQHLVDFVQKYKIPIERTCEEKHDRRDMDEAFIAVNRWLGKHGTAARLVFLDYPTGAVFPCVWYKGNYPNDIQAGKEFLHDKESSNPAKAVKAALVKWDERLNNVEWGLYMDPGCDIFGVTKAYPGQGDCVPQCDSMLLK